MVKRSVRKLGSLKRKLREKSYCLRVLKERSTSIQRSFFLIFVLDTDRHFHSLRASTSGDWRIVCSSGPSCHGFRSSEVLKGSVGALTLSASTSTWLGSPAAAAISSLLLRRIGTQDATTRRENAASSRSREWEDRMLIATLFFSDSQSIWTLASKERFGENVLEQSILILEKKTSSGNDALSLFLISGEAGTGDLRASPATNFRDNLLPGKIH